MKQNIKNGLAIGVILLLVVIAFFSLGFLEETNQVIAAAIAGSILLNLSFF